MNLFSKLQHFIRLSIPTYAVISALSIKCVIILVIALQIGSTVLIMILKQIHIYQQSR